GASWCAILAKISRPGKEPPPPSKRKEIRRWFPTEGRQRKREYKLSADIVLYKAKPASKHKMRKQEPNDKHEPIAIDKKKQQNQDTTIENSDNQDNDNVTTVNNDIVLQFDDTQSWEIQPNDTHTEMYSMAYQQQSSSMINDSEGYNNFL